jgi:glucokinase
VSDGKIYHGATPGESEIGHVRLSPDGTTLESRCSGWAMDRRIRELNQREPNGVLGRLCRGATASGGEALFLGDALNQNDRAAQKILAAVIADLAFGLSHVVHLFHPAVIILGGGLSQVGEPLRAAVQAALTPLVMEVFQPGLTVRLAALGEDAVPVGALLLASGGGNG